MSQYREQFEDEPLVERIKKNPRPALRWAIPMAVLFALEFGAFWSFVMDMPWEVFIGGLADLLPASLAGALTAATDFLGGIGGWLADFWTLLDRGNIPNRGHQLPDGSWEGTFLGLEPALAWSIRVALTYAYGFGVLYWAWRGYITFRDNYRYAEWTPTDDVVDRLRRHRWGQFGMVVVVVFVLLAMFAPTLGPTVAKENIYEPYQHEIQYLDSQTNTVETASIGSANLYSGSKGDSQNYGLLSYDDYGRWHPLGTLDNGKDLFTFMAQGARVSLFIGLLASFIAGGVALGLALLTAYYKGLLDLVAVVTSDSFVAMPYLLIIIMLAVVLSDTWIAQVYSGGLLLALIFGVFGWPFLWRAVRGPAFQTVENEWIDAAESFGQKPRVLVRKHVMPYVLGYLLIYLSMNLGGYMISTAALSYLGLGVQSPTPEWGRAIADGQQYITSASWHISILPGLAITLIVVGFNALGDGIRDAIDPQSEGATSDEVAAAGGGA